MIGHSGFTLVMSILPTLLSSNFLSRILHNVPSDILSKGLTFGLNL